MARPPKTIELTDPRALRAVAHPVRLELVGLLRREGPLTATQAGARLGESPSSCSFHLRQLARHGLVEDAGGGRGRERPWRATALSTSWADTSNDPELDAASELLNAVVADRYVAQLREWLARRSQEPAEWREAATFGDALVFATPSELAELSRELRALGDRYVERRTNPQLRPPGARAVTVLQIAFPTSERPQPS